MSTRKAFKFYDIDYNLSILNPISNKNLIQLASIRCKCSCHKDFSDCEIEHRISIGHGIALADYARGIIAVGKAKTLPLRVKFTEKEVEIDENSFRMKYEEVSNCGREFLNSYKKALIQSIIINNKVLYVDLREEDPNTNVKANELKG